MGKKTKLIILILILALSIFLRLYRISDYMTFLGDEGRDVAVAREILHGDFTLLGPRASAGDFFLGPIYYYMITPFLWIFNYDPVGPAVMVALFGVATVYLVYFTGKKFFDERAGLFAASLYAVSPLVITYSRSSWNPNVLPFFALLIMYVVYKATYRKDAWKFYLLAGFLLGIALQLHYLALLLGVIVGVYVVSASLFLNKKKSVLTVPKNYLEILIGFLIGFSPFLAFEIRHGFPNIKTISGFILGDTLNKGYDAGISYFTIVVDVFFRTFGRLVFNFPTPDRYEKFSQLTLDVFGAIIVLIAFASIIALFFRKDKLSVRLLLIWLVFGLLLFGFYKKPIFDYYLTFLFPLPFLLVGSMLSFLSNWEKRTGFTLSIILFAGVFAYNLTGVPFLDEPNRQKDQIKTISEFVIEKSDYKPYNFALLASGNSDHGYRYYFDILGHEPVRIDNTIDDPERKTVTDQLLVVCEEKVCEPLGHPLFDIAGFGRASVEEEWSISVVKVYKLVPYVE